MTDQKRIIFFLVFISLGIVAFFELAIGLYRSDSELYSHVPAVYGIMAYLVFKDRKRILGELHSSAPFGAMMILIAAGAYAYEFANRAALSQNNQFSILSASFVFYLVGIASLFLGVKTLRKIGFGLFMLLFAIPFPDFVLSKVILYLQLVSTSSTVWILERIHIFPIREGFILRMPEISIEVAEACSGIRSSIALVIVSFLYGYYFLRTYWSRTFLVLFAIFVAPFKNGLRIATLTLISIYWDKRVMTGALHTSGGIPFFVLGLVLVSIALYLLIKIEKISFSRYSGGKWLFRKGETP